MGFSKEEKETIAYVKELMSLYKYGVNLTYTDKENDTFKVLLNLIDRQDKMINLMVYNFSLVMLDIEDAKRRVKEEYCELLTSDEDCCWKHDKTCDDCIKEYFKRIAEE